MPASSWRGTLLASRPVATAAWVVVALVLIILPAFAGVVPSRTSAAPKFDSHIASSSATAPGAGVEQLLAAERSLQYGAPPSRGEPIACQANPSGESASCAPQGRPALAGTGRGTADPVWRSLNAPSGFDLVPVETAYDAKDGYVVLIDENPPGTASETWKFKAGSWIQLFPVSPPGPRFGGSLAYDAKDGYVVLFGGDGPTGQLHDTWKFVGGKWTELFPAASPPGRSTASMAYDATDGYVVLFGGFNSTILVGLADTWKFVGGSWTLLSPSTPPVGREEAAMAFDARDGYILLFGGFNDTTFFNFGDTWKFVGGQWTQLSPIDSPMEREGAGMTYDAKDGYIVLFGGSCVQDQPCFPPALPFYQDTWKFEGGAWTNITPKLSPPSGGPDLTYDGLDGYTIFLGGKDGINNNTWKFIAGVWTSPFPRPVQISPPARTDAMMAYDPKDGFVVLFGGFSSAFVSVADTWKFVGGQWHRLFPSTSPPAQDSAAMVYDAKDGYVLLFGGCFSGAGTSDTWKFVGGQWTQLFPSTLPTARTNAGIAYDARDGYVVLFGGVTCSASALGDTWKFVGGQWARLSPPTHPTARWAMAMTYDAADGYVLLFGGKTSAASQNDTWKFVGGKWTQLFPSTHPSALLGASITYDAKTSYVLVFGGSSGGPKTWKFSGGIWTLLTSPANPFNRQQGGMAFDGKDGFAVLFGGTLLSNRFADDTWEFS